MNWFKKSKEQKRRLKQFLEGVEKANKEYKEDIKYINDFVGENLSGMCIETATAKILRKMAEVYGKGKKKNGN